MPEPLVASEARMADEVRGLGVGNVECIERPLIPTAAASTEP